MESEKKRGLERELECFFSKALEDGVFPGAAVAVQYPGLPGKSNVIKGYYGCTDSLGPCHRVGEQTVFDLASLTKPLVTVLLVLTLLEKGTVSLDDTLAELLPSFTVPADKRQIRLWQLMAHCSGLAAHRTYYRQLLGIPSKGRGRYVIDSILGESLAYRPGEKHVYSDLGYMLLGVVIEQQTGKSIREAFQEIVMPLELNEHLFFPKEGQLDIAECAATEACAWTHRRLCGTVHDDNCRLMGGQAGHAGLFGTLDGVLRLCGVLYRCWHGKEEKLPVSADIFQKVTARVGRSTWSCGFDTPTKLYSSSGKYFSKTTIGHLGFTGTSFWMDLERGIWIVLLTNRVCPTRKNEKIKRLRPRLHDLIMEKLVA